MDDKGDLEEALRLSGYVIVTKAFKRLAYEFACRAPVEAEISVEIVLQAIARDFATFMPQLDTASFEPFRNSIANAVQGLLDEARADARFRRLS